VRLDQAGSPPLAIGRPVARPHHDLDLPPGATLLFFTDGLVEQRGTDLGERLLVLEDAFARTGTDPEDVCERLLATMVDAGGNEDDIAVVCVHLS
jgi:serine phosphatase RsbU (regulator of sigma subunit)